jgi:hypothetical protein
MTSPVPTEALAREAMKLMCEAHPHLTYQQVMLIMRDAEWSFEDDKATCNVKLPPDIPEKIEINLVPTTD